ncbi:MAG: PKD domain-containing protein [Thermoanaerobaculia bacterium]
MRKALPALAALLLLAPAPLLAQASASARWVDNEGCWCGYQTGLVRDYWVRGRSSTTADKQATADMLDEWNRYVKLFNVKIDSSTTLGSHNGVNEVNTFITSSEANAQYGFTMEPGLFGRAVMYPDASFGDFNECKDFAAAGCGAFTETDVVVNAGFGSGWTPDWFNPGNDQRGGLAMVQATVLHEVGHTLGLHHIFRLPGTGADSFSVMNYANDDAARWVTRIDSKTVRTEYPARSGALVDVAIYPLAYGNDQYAQEYATLSKSSVSPGESFTADRWTIQNVGNQAASNVVVTFYAWPKSSGRQYPQPTDVVLVRADAGTVGVDAEGTLTGTPLTVPAGTAAGEYYVGAIVTVAGAEDLAWVAGKPSNNRFILGHDPRLVLRVLSSGSGGSPVTADFSWTPVSPLAGQPVGFVDASRGSPTTYSWSFGDASSGSANTSTAKSPSHTYANPGSYTVTLSVSGNGSSNQTQRTIAIAGKPTGSGTASQTLFVPIVLDVGGVGGARFGSELTLANRGTSTATVSMTYTGSYLLGGGAGSGTVTETLAPGRQLILPDALAYLRSKGRPIPSDGSSQGGTLRVRFDGLSSEDAGYAVVRTTTPSGNGRAGLSYPGLTPSQLLTGDSVIVGLREDFGDRSNLALANAGTSGTISLKVYIVKGDGSAAVYIDPDYVLGPGQWTQIGRVLDLAGYTDGWILVEQTAGTEPYTAYAVFNDNATNDGSYVPAVPVESVDAFGTVPVLVETSVYRSELVVSNLSEEPGYAFLEYFESAAAAGESTGLFYVELNSLEQAIFPDVLQELRGAGASIGPRGPTYAGALSVAYASDTSLLVGLSGARTAAPAPGGGQYGLFYTSLAGAESAVDAWLFGLQQGTSARSNLAIVNAGLFNEPIRVRLEVYNGLTGQKVSEEILDPLQPGQWTQKNGVLGGVANGYVHLTVLDGFDAFYAYATVVDGKDSLSGTNDGSYVPMVVSH